MKKIPDNAKLAFKGVLHEVYQWEQQMFDGTYATFEAIKRPDTVTVIATTADRMLLNDEEQPNRSPFIAMPGGVADDEESTLLENAKRELKEETGYESCDWGEWFTSDVFQSQKIDWNNYFFIAKNVVKVSEPQLDAGEKIKTKLITFDEFLALRHDSRFRNKDLIPLLEEASKNQEKRKELEKILFTQK